MKKLFINCEGDINMICEKINSDDYYIVMYGTNKGNPYEIRIRRKKLLSIFETFLLIDSAFHEKKEEVKDE